MQPQTGSLGRFRVIVVNSMERERSDGWCPGVDEGRTLDWPRQIHAFHRRAIGSALWGGNSRSCRRIVVKGQGNRQNRSSFLLVVGWRVVIVIVFVVSRMLVGGLFVLVAVMSVLGAMMFVLVVTNVEVEVEEGGAVSPVPMPVTGSLQTETADADNNGGCQNRSRQAGQSEYGAAEVSHVLILTDRTRHALQRRGNRRHDCEASGLNHLSTPFDRNGSACPASPSRWVA